MKIFLASPGDVDQLSPGGEACRGSPQRGERRQNLGSAMFLEIVDWNRHITPLMSLPESAVMERIEVGKHDVFFGPCLARLSTAWVTARPPHGGLREPPTPARRPNAISRSPYNYWRAKQPSQCLLYQLHAPAREAHRHRRPGFRSRPAVFRPLHARRRRTPRATPSSARRPISRNNWRAS